MWEVADIAVADTVVVVVAADDDVAGKDRNVQKMMSEEVEGPSLQ